MSVGPSDTDFEDASYILSSRYRLTVMRRLSETGPAIPSVIAEENGDDIAHISRALRELDERGLVKLLVPEHVQKGRVYGITAKGEDELDKVETLAPQVAEDE